MKRIALSGVVAAGCCLAVVRDRRPKGWAINACSLDLGPRRRVSREGFRAEAGLPVTRPGCGLMPAAIYPARSSIVAFI